MLQVHAKNLDTFTVLCVQGQIVTGETDVLRAAFLSLAETPRVILDLAKVSIVDAHAEMKQRAPKNIRSDKRPPS